MLLDYLRLVRLPNAMTAIADSAMGYLVIARSVESPGRMAALAGASALLYSAGMVWNDYFDVELDRRERPERPLPSGRVSLTAARVLGSLLMVGGIASAWWAGAGSGRWFPGALGLALVLAALILLYDRWLKPTVWGPAGMGACRATNVWMGAAAGWGALDRVGLPTDPGLMAILLGFATYVIGLTWFARDEQDTSRPARLAAAALMMGVGVAAVASAPWVGGPAWTSAMKLQPAWLYPLLVTLLTIVLARHWISACRDPSPQRVRTAVKQSIFFLIVLDAAIVLAMVGPQPAVGMLGLLLVATWLGRWIAST